MTTQELVDEIKFVLTGGVLELELDDKAIGQAIKQALRELERYWDETTLVTLPYASCIDFSNSDLDLKEKVNAVVRVYRTEGAGNNSDAYNERSSVHAAILDILKRRYDVQRARLHNEFHVLQHYAINQKHSLD